MEILDTTVVDRACSAEDSVTCEADPLAVNLPSPPTENLAPSVLQEIVPQASDSQKPVSQEFVSQEPVSQKTQTESVEPVGEDALGQKETSHTVLSATQSDVPMDASSLGVIPTSQESETVVQNSACKELLSEKPVEEEPQTREAAEQETFVSEPTIATSAAVSSGDSLPLPTVVLPVVAEEISKTDTQAKASASAAIVLDVDDAVDDIVPVVSYEDKKSLFSKDGRFIIPKREQFPSIFCGLRVLVKLEAAQDGLLDSSIIEQIVHDDLGFEANIVHWEMFGSGLTNMPDEDTELERGVQNIAIALSGALRIDQTVGTTVEVPRFNVVAQIVGIKETCDDFDPLRIMDLAKCFHEGVDNDAIVFELPQLWVIPDPDFRAKTASIGLYPGSYWMGFLRCWGPVDTAEIFFKTVKRPCIEPKVHLVVKYKDRDSLKMCFTFLRDRYLAHPKKELGLRPPWCQLIRFQEFTNAAGKGKTGAKTGAKSPAKAPAKSAKSAKSAAKSAAKSVPKCVDTGKAPQRVETTPMTPMPKADGAPKAKARPVARGTVVAADATPAQAMQSLSGKQLEAFQMVMTRMERLEGENQELMHILLQMQGLLQQQQQRGVPQAGQNQDLRAQAVQAAASRALQLSGDTALTAKVPPPHPPHAFFQPPCAPATPVIRAGKRGADVDGANPHGLVPAGDEAPWKRYRKTVRRAPRQHSIETCREAASPGTGGLAAYHDALLGV